MVAGTPTPQSNQSQSPSDNSGSSHVWQDILQAILGRTLSSMFGMGQAGSSMDKFKGRENNELNQSSGDRPQPGQYPGENQPMPDMSMTPQGGQGMGYKPGTNPRMLLMMAKMRGQKPSGPDMGRGGYG